jgi:hypothetical protein
MMIRTMGAILLLWLYGIDPTLGQVEEQYGLLPEQRLDLCRPIMPRPGGSPGAVMIHGGGWKSGAARDLTISAPWPR